MIEQLENKYVELLLKRCLNFDKSKSLLISYDKVNKKFCEKIINKANEMGVQDIYIEETDVYKEHDILKLIKLDEIDNNPYFNKKVWDEYAKKNASFLMIDTEFPGIMDDIEPGKLSRAKYIERSTKPIYKEKQGKGEIPWCIASFPNKIWADSIFPNESNSAEKLFLVICKMCMIDKENPIESWNLYLKEAAKIEKKLNDLKIKQLHYKNSLGTDLIIELNDNAIWCSAASNENKMLVNMPSYEIFTTPNYKKTNGIVYSSKPLVHNGGLIDEFYIRFKDGKVVDFNAKKGYEILKGIIESDSQSCYLGECALVNNDSPISNTGLVFGTTLFDENASCHLALGDGFEECIENGFNMNKEELLNSGVNHSNTHVDFMIGTSDMNIIATTKTSKKLIFKEGNFNL